MRWLRLPQNGSGMSTRVRTLVLLVVMSVWVAVVVVTLMRDQLPDVAMMGIPAAIILALGFSGGSGPSDPPATPEPTSEVAP